MARRPAEQRQAYKSHPCAAKMEDCGDRIVFSLLLARDRNGAMWSRFGQYCQYPRLIFSDGIGVRFNFGSHDHVVSFFSRSLNDNAMNVLRHYAAGRRAAIPAVVSPLGPENIWLESVEDDDGEIRIDLVLARDRVNED